MIKIILPQTFLTVRVVSWRIGVQIDCLGCSKIWLNHFLWMEFSCMYLVNITAWALFTAPSTFPIASPILARLVVRPISWSKAEILVLVSAIWSYQKQIQALWNTLSFFEWAYLSLTAAVTLTALGSSHRLDRDEATACIRAGLVMFILDKKLTNCVLTSVTWDF